MKYQTVVHILGNILVILGGTLGIPTFLAFYYDEPIAVKLAILSIFIMVLGAAVSLTIKRTNSIGYREAFTIVSFSWLAAAFVGALPYWVTGVIPDFASAFFESMSGFTTTGASILTDVEVIPKSIMFWRGLTHWLGGMGIIVLFVALLSQLGTGAMQVFKAEASGPITEKVMPRISETAKILWFTYVIMTVVLALALKFAGMGWFDSLFHSFSAVSTGGFSTKNASIGYFNSATIDWLITLFMFLGGVNFTLYFAALRKKSLKRFWENQEFRAYLYITLISGILISLYLWKDYGSFLEAARYGFFQVVSLFTTTGFMSTNYEVWPAFTLGILFFVMFIGGSAGSTSGGIKTGRWLVLWKNTGLELKKQFHPKAVFSLRIGSNHYSEGIIVGILQFIALYFFILIIGSLTISFLGFDLLTAFTSALACLGNIGPGFGEVGPAENYSHIPALGKYILSLLMLIGRLELYTILVLFLPSFWRK